MRGELRCKQAALVEAEACVTLRHVELRLAIVQQRRRLASLGAWEHHRHRCRQKLRLISTENFTKEFHRFMSMRCKSEVAVLLCWARTMYIQLATGTPARCSRAQHTTSYDCTVL